MVVLAMAALCLLSGTSSAASASTGDIKGTVVTHNGTPLKYANVQLLNNEGVVNSTMTDAQGKFNFTDIVPGNYTIRAIYGGSRNETVVSVMANRTMIVNLTVMVESATDDDTGNEKDSMILFPIVAIAILFLIALIIVGIVIAYNYSKITSDRLMEHETRMKIFEHIQNDPGQHLRKIGSDLDLPMGVLTHHIGKLEKEEVIKSRIDGKFKRYYPWDSKIENKPWLSELQNNMIQMIKGQPGISTNDLVERAGGSRSNAYYHISELESKGLIRVDKMEKKHKCYLVQDT